MDGNKGREEQIKQTIRSKRMLLMLSSLGGNMTRGDPKTGAADRTIAPNLLS